MNYERQIIHTKNEAEWLDLRLRDITSTDCAALFGKSKYMSPYKLWWSKKNAVIKRKSISERMEWGTRLQDTIAAGIAEDHHFDITRMDEYIRIPELRLGSSFDFKIGDDVILEIKNVGGDAFKDWWVFDDEDASAPPHIEIQVQHQLAVSGFKLAYIGALIGGNKSVLIRRERNEGLINEIFQRTAEFWSTVDAGVPPPPDFAVDSEFISAMARHAEPGKVHRASPEAARLCQSYSSWGRIAKKAEDKRKEIKAKILLEMGDAEKAYGDGFSISAGLVGPSEYVVKRDGYRNFKVTIRDVDKSKKAA